MCTDEIVRRYEALETIQSIAGSLGASEITGRNRLLAAGVELRKYRQKRTDSTPGDANVSANVIMAKTGHKSLRSVQRYVKPGLAAVHEATEILSSPHRRG